MRTPTPVAASRCGSLRCAPRRTPPVTLFDDGVEDVTEIRWHEEDALPAALCLAVDGIETAAAWGNIVLADHGATVAGDEGDGEHLGAVPVSRLVRGPADCEGGAESVPARFRPSLRHLPLTRVLVRDREVLATAPFTAALEAELQGSASKDEPAGALRRRRHRARSATRPSCAAQARCTR